ncbi:MAG: ABC transporter substrate-binding protein [Chloroflexi bacterium]|nr:ABC transporter substrate-binding protein [Chloroflexota bacterium]
MPGKHLLLRVLAFALLFLVACAPAAPAPAKTEPAKVQPTKAAPAKAESAKPEPTKAVPPKAEVAKSVATPTKAPPAPAVKVRVGAVGSLSDAGVYVALEKAYFKEQGIDFEMVSFDSASQMIAPMSSSQLEVGGGAFSTGLFNAILRNIPMKAVADKGTNSAGHGFAALVVRKDLYDSGQVRGYKDLKGRKLAVSNLGGGSEIQMEKALGKGGLKVSDVDLIALSHPAQLAAYGNKALEASILLEPLVTEGVEKGLVVKIAGADEFDPSVGASILYAPHFMDKMSDAANRWMVAYLKGVRDYNDAFGPKKKDRAAIITLLTKQTSVKDAALYEKMVMPGLDSNGEIKLSDLESQLKWYRGRDLLKEDLDPKRVLDAQYADNAVKQLGKYVP